MSAEKVVLREAAAKVRSVAFQAVDGPWAVDEIGGVWTCENEGATQISQQPEDADAAHIALWHPAVALAVADWLDAIVERDPSGQSVEAEPALRVARLILGADQ